MVGFLKILYNEIMLTVLYNAKINENDEAVLIEDAFINEIGSNEEILNKSFEAIPVDVKLCEIRHAKRLIKKNVFEGDVLKVMNELASQGVVSVMTNVSKEKLQEIEKVYESGDAPVRCELLLNAEDVETMQNVRLNYQQDPWLKLSGYLLEDLSKAEAFFQKSNEVRMPLYYAVEDDADAVMLKPYCDRFHKLFREEVIKGSTLIRKDEVADLIVMRNGRAIMTLNEGYIVFRR